MRVLRRRTRIARVVPVAVLLVTGAAGARDAFDAVRCGKDVPGALIGRELPETAVSRTESRHRDLKLKDLGGDEISDQLGAAEWSICGADYQFLYDSARIIRDVMPFPPHRRASPEFAGICQRNGRTQPDAVVAILDMRGARVGASAHYSAADATTLPAKVAWRIDERSKRFVALPTTGLGCPRSGIITADGGP